ncbi:MAG: gliding motility-associated C-terminal domain-containing protein [Saprospiraceae bacterium]
MKAGYLLTGLIILIAGNFLFATHNRAGEINFNQISEQKILVTVTTYTKTSSVSADRDSILIEWGDGTSSNISRTNGNGFPLANNVKKNIYQSEHTYPGRGTYIISVQDPNRIDNILNIDPPNSVNIPFYIQTTVTLLNLQFQSPNNSVKLLQAPIDFACVGHIFIHNPSAYDEDGDSLSYELAVPLMEKNTPVPNYYFPNQIQSGLNNNISLNSNSGTFIWDSPQKPGEYNIVIVIHEFRKGVKIATTIRDMQIFVRNDCALNQTPFINAIKDTCIVAGMVLNLDILAIDRDTALRGSKIKIEAIGAPFFTTPSASFSPSTQYMDSPIQAKFQWVTDCSLIQKEYYTLVIKVTDNYLDTTGLSYLHTIRIKIVGPAPENLNSVSQNKSIFLTWNKPYLCDTNTLLFRGFSVWRKERSSLLVLDTCNPGLDRSNYTRIAYLVNQNNGNNYFYQDSLIEKGTFYCYRVLAEFAKLSSSNFPYNFVSSLHSNETCNSIAIENPLILNVDVKKTDAVNGEIFIRWLKPEPLQFDTILNRAPYRTAIWQSDDMLNWQEINTSIRNYPSFSAIQDTQFLHTTINTINKQYSYIVNINAVNAINHASDTAQNIFLKVSPTDRTALLQWNSKTPWTNYLYTIYRFNTTSQQFDSIGFTDQNSYKDIGLLNEVEYCYLIKSTGEYGIDAIEHPLFNNSNIRCTVPVDNRAPCCPDLTIKGPCDEIISSNPDKIINKLSWNNPNSTCSDQDAIGYRIYTLQAGQLTLLQEINNILQTEFEHTLNENTPTCYKISAFDKYNNECINSDSVCVKYCPFYKLPNTFTPNGDGQNDIFKPFPYRFIDRIQISIFNRWGNLVFQTTDPNIEWTGLNMAGNKLSDGVYYYHCTVYYTGPTVEGTTSETLAGFIELLSGKK